MARGLTVPKITSQVGSPRLYEALKDIVTRVSTVTTELDDNKVDGGGTEGYLPVFSAAKTLEDSPAYTDGTSIVIGGTTPTAGFLLDVVGSARANAIKLSTGAADGRILTSDADGDATWQLPVRVVTTDYRRIVCPTGAQYATTTASVTGAVRIKLPTACYANDTMLSFRVKLFNHVAGKSAEWLISGRNAAGAWTNCTAVQVSGDLDTKKVRFGRDGTRDVVWIGELADAWAYPQAGVFDVLCGYNGNSINWLSGWVIDFASSFDTVDITITSSACGIAPGSITMHGSTNAPNGWLICDGSVVAQASYAALYGVVGTAFNTGGEGAGNFRLPDMRQRFPLGFTIAGTGSTFGGTGGTIDHTHTADPPNTATSTPSGITQVEAYSVASQNVSSTSHTHTVDIASFNTGTANPPFLALTFIIKT